MWQQIHGGLYAFLSSHPCYALIEGHRAVLIEHHPEALAQLETLGVTEVLGVLLTHVHPESEGIPIHIQVEVPQAEHPLFTHPEGVLARRQRFNRYRVLRDDHLPETGREAGKLLDHDRIERLGTFEVVPTPGHTPGSVTLLLNHQGKRFAFVGDLLSGPGQVQDLSFTQWSYGGGEGLAGSVLSLLDLQDRNIDVLLPAHGQIMWDAQTALFLTVDRLWALVQLRRHNPRLKILRDAPFVPVTKGVLMNRTSFAHHYVVLSSSGKALFIDFGYDFMFGMADSTERHARRPWLYNLPHLKRFGVTHIDAVIPTHIHDDHVAGIPLLKRVHGTRVLLPKRFAEVLEHPERWDVPCQWFDPIEADQWIEESFVWEEHTFKVIPLPGHTPHAVGILLDIDGERLLFQGDVLADDGLTLNYIYQNDFDPADFVQVARTLQAEKPTLLLGGHWDPVRITPEWLDQLQHRAETLQELHHQLQPPLQQEPEP